MPVSVPVWVLIVLVMFGVGYVITSKVLIAIKKLNAKGNGTKTKQMDGTPITKQKPGREKYIEPAAVVGGCIFVVLMALLPFIIPLKWAIVAWIVAVIIGVLFLALSSW